MNKRVGTAVAVALLAIAAWAASPLQPQRIRPHGRLGTASVDVAAMSLTCESQDSIFVGQTVQDPAGDVSPGFVDIVQVTSGLVGETLTATFTLQSLPATITVNQPGVPDNDPEYEWSVYVDTDNDVGTGSNAWRVEGTEYALDVYHFKLPGSSPQTLPIQSALTANVYQWQAAGYWQAIAFGTFTFSTTSGTLVMSGIVPGIKPTSRVVFGTWYTDPQNAYHYEWLGGCRQAACTSPSITSQPQSQSILSGQSATLSVTANGSAPFSYQWYQGSSGDTSHPVGSNASSYTTPALTTATSYWVLVFNSCGQVASAAATVSIGASCTMTDVGDITGIPSTLKGTDAWTSPNGRSLVFTGGPGGMAIIDAVSQVKLWDVPHSAWQTIGDSAGHAYLAAAASGVLAFAVGEATSSPQEIGTGSTSGQTFGLALLPGEKFLLAAGDTAGLELYQLDGAGHPLPFASYATRAPSWAVAQDNGLVASASTSFGIELWQWDGASALVPRGALALNGPIYDVELCHGYLYASAQDSKLWVVDVTNPDAPKLANQTNVWGLAYDAACNWPYLAVASSSTAPGDPGQVALFDISQPAAPKLLGFASAAYPTSVTFAAGKVFAGREQHGVSIYSMAGCSAQEAHLTVQRNGSGTVTSSPTGISCGSACDASFPWGAQVALTASPTSGYTFAGWGGDCSGAGTATTCTVTLDQAERTVSATFASPTCAAQRTLPGGYAAGQPVAVSIAITPPSGTQNYAVEEAPPSGWSVSGIDNGGTWDATNTKVKWGPFFDSSARTLHYSATPPAGTTGTKNFAGTLSLDGANQTICGQSSINSALFHPADTSKNWRIEIGELTAYGTAWKQGATWPTPPNPIPIAYVTNAGLLWKSGEVYHYDASQNPPWVPGASSQAQLRETNVPATALAVVGRGSAVCTFNPTSHQVGAGVQVSIAVTPGSGTQVYALEGAPPSGWAVSTVDNGGAFDSTNGKVKWGPFFDNAARTLTYTVTPPVGGTGTRTFAGMVSFDGVNVPITGARSIP